MQSLIMTKFISSVLAMVTIILFQSQISAQEVCRNAKDTCMDENNHSVCISLIERGCKKNDILELNTCPRQFLCKKKLDYESEDSSSDESEDSSSDESKDSSEDLTVLENIPVNSSSDESEDSSSDESKDDESKDSSEDIKGLENIPVNEEIVLTKLLRDIIDESCTREKLLDDAGYNICFDMCRGRECCYIPAKECDYLSVGACSVFQSCSLLDLDNKMIQEDGNYVASLAEQQESNLVLGDSLSGSTCAPLFLGTMVSLFLTFYSLFN